MTSPARHTYRRRSRRASYQSGFDSLGKLFIQSVHVVPLGCQLGAIFKLHLQSTNMQSQEANVPGLGCWAHKDPELHSGIIISSPAKCGSRSLILERAVSNSTLV